MEGCKTKPVVKLLVLQTFLHQFFIVNHATLYEFSGATWFVTFLEISLYISVQTGLGPQIGIFESFVVAFEIGGFLHRT